MKSALIAAAALILANVAFFVFLWRRSSRLTKCDDCGAHFDVEFDGRIDDAGARCQECRDAEVEHHRHTSYEMPATSVQGYLVSKARARAVS